MTFILQQEYVDATSTPTATFILSVSALLNFYKIIKIIKNVFLIKELCNKYSIVIYHARVNVAE